MKERRFERRENVASGEEYLSDYAKVLRGKIADLSWAHQQINLLERLPSTHEVEMVRIGLHRILGDVLDYLGYNPVVDDGPAPKIEGRDFCLLPQSNMPSRPESDAKELLWKEVIYFLCEYLDHSCDGLSARLASYFLKRIQLSNYGNLRSGLNLKSKQDSAGA